MSDRLGTTLQQKLRFMAMPAFISMDSPYVCISALPEGFKMKIILTIKNNFSFPMFTHSVHVFPIHSQAFIYRDRATNLHLFVKNCLEPKHYFSGEEDTVHFANWLLQETVVLQYPRLPHVLLCWEIRTKQETDPAKTAVDLWHRGKCDWTRPIPIWAGSHCRTWRFMTRMTQLITLGYWRELDMDRLQGGLVCVFVFIIWQMKAQ